MNSAIKQRSLWKFPNRNWSVSFTSKLLRKIDHTVNEDAVLDFQWRHLNVNDMDVVAYFSEVICHFLLIYFQVHMLKMSATSDNFLLSYRTST